MSSLTLRKTGKTHRVDYDGRKDRDDHRPYHRVIASCGCWDISGMWREPELGDTRCKRCFGAKQ